MGRSRWILPVLVALVAAPPMRAGETDLVVGTDETGHPLTVAQMKGERNFRGVRFKADVAWAELGLREFSGADFTGACLRKVDLSGCVFRKTDFTRADLTQARLPSGLLEQKDLIFEGATDPEGRPLGLKSLETKHTGGDKGERTSSSTSSSSSSTTTLQTTSTGSEETKAPVGEENLGEKVEETALHAFFSTSAKVGTLCELEVEGGVPFRLARWPLGIAWIAGNKETLHFACPDTLVQFSPGPLVDLGWNGTRLWYRYERDNKGRVCDLAWNGESGQGFRLGRFKSRSSEFGWAHSGPDQLVWIDKAPVYIQTDPTWFTIMRGQGMAFADYLQGRLGDEGQIRSLRTSEFGDLFCLGEAGFRWQPGTEEKLKGLRLPYPKESSGGKPLGRTCMVRWSKYQLLLHRHGRLYRYDLRNMKDLLAKGPALLELKGSKGPLQVQDMAVGPDGCVWLTLPHGNSIGRLDTSQNLTLFPLPHANSIPAQIIDGGDGKMYFQELGARRIGSIVARSSAKARKKTSETKISTSSSSKEETITDQVEGSTDTEVNTKVSQSGQNDSTLETKALEDPEDTTGSLHWVGDGWRTVGSPKGLADLGIKEVPWEHLEDHYFGKIEDKSQFLEYLSNRKDLSALIQETVAQAPNVQAVRTGRWLCEHTFEYQVGNFYEPQKQKHLPTRKVLVVLSPDGTKVISAYPVP